jgi:aspartate carbamoyltransferase regulatory subunit
MKELKISAIREGTVIDHIPSDNTLKVFEILNLDELDNTVSVAFNLKSQDMGKKGIIKVGGLNLKKKDVQRIALIAPDATLNIIKDYKVVDKKRLEMPKLLDNIVKCINPDCITNKEPVRTSFVIEKTSPCTVRCGHCERCTTEIELL